MECSWCHAQDDRPVRMVDNKIMYWENRKDVPIETFPICVLCYMDWHVAEYEPEEVEDEYYHGFLALPEREG